MSNATSVELFKELRRLHQSYSTVETAEALSALDEAVIEYSHDTGRQIGVVLTGSGSFGQMEHLSDYDIAGCLYSGDELRKGEFVGGVQNRLNEEHRARMIDVGTMIGFENLTRSLSLRQQLYFLERMYDGGLLLGDQDVFQRAGMCVRTMPSWGEERETFERCLEGDLRVWREAWDMSLSKYEKRMQARSVGDLDFWQKRDQLKKQLVSQKWRL